MYRGSGPRASSPMRGSPSARTAGAAPDVGAFERGWPAPGYGVDAGRTPPTWIRGSRDTGSRAPAEGAPWLGQNYPNPFNGSTLLRLACPSARRVRLSVYDVLGRELVTLVDGPSAGALTVRWDGRDSRGRAVGSGQYFGVLRAEDQTVVRKLVLVR